MTGRQVSFHLFHHPLSPHCRKIRLVLGEKKLPVALVEEPVWQRRDDFLALNPAGEVPVLVDEGHALADSAAIAEYLDETFPDPPLVGGTPLGRAEARRLTAWFDLKFQAEVTANLVGEKVWKRQAGGGGPESAALRAGMTNLRYHLDYIGYLSDRRRWLAGDDLSIADLAAAAHLSCLDYIGDVPWDDHPLARDWYARIKSRPSFRPLLGDHITGMPPARHYANLDF